MFMPLRRCLNPKDLPVHVRERHRIVDDLEADIRPVELSV
jgi:hypothetical protein